MEDKEIIKDLENRISVLEKILLFELNIEDKKSEKNGSLTRLKNISSMEKTKEQKNKRRYNLHYKLRKKGIKFVTVEKTFKIGHTDKTYAEDETARKWINELINNHQYGVQLIIE